MPRKRVTARICSTTSMPSWSRSHVSWLSCASSIATFVSIVDVTSTYSVGLEAESHHGVHEVDRGDLVVVGTLALEQRQRRVEAAVEDELRRLVVVGHVVAGGVRDDQVGAHVAHEIDHRGALVVVACVDLSVGEAERDVGGAGQLGGAPRLAQPDLRDLLRGVLEAAAVAERRVAHHDLMPLLDETCQRAAAEDLEIVRVRADGEDAHQRAIAGMPNRPSSTVTMPTGTASAASGDRARGIARRTCTESVAGGAVGDDDPAR